MKIKVYEDRYLVSEEIVASQYENLATTLEFEFPEYVDKNGVDISTIELNKYIVFDIDAQENQDLIVDNKYSIPYEIAKLNEITFLVKMTEATNNQDMSDKLIWNSRKMTIRLNAALEGNTNITSEKIDAFNTAVTTLNQKTTEVDTTIKTVETKLEEGELNGKDGIDGLTPYIKDNYWYIGDKNTGVIAKGQDGKDGTNGKDYILTDSDKKDISKLVEVNTPTKVSQLENDKEYATESFVVNKIAEAELGGGDSGIDLSGLATKDELNSKVDKVTGKSLIADSEIARLANVTNYDDTELKNQINSKASISDMTDYIEEHKEELKGDAGKDGEDGFSPTINTSKSGKVTTLTITDINGTKTATILDGEDGKDGTGGSSTGGELISIYKGKKLSILGDSISTFSGYVPSENAVYYNGSVAGVSSVNDTWWKKLIDALEMELDTNNSWSGSRVTTTNGEQSAGCMTRCENLGSPDVIIVYLGINDFNNEVALGTYNGTGDFPTATTTFKEAYSIMLNKILNKYSTSEVLICTLPYCENNTPVEFPEKNGNNVLLKEFNNAIRDLADLFNVDVIDLTKSGLNYQNMNLYMGDYSDSSALHPNSYGHSLIANYMIKHLDNAIRTRYDVQGVNLMYNWDFTQSLTDTVSGRTITGVATRDTNGLKFSNGLTYADCGDNIMGRNKTIEIDFGDMTSNFTNVNGIFFWVSVPEARGFGWNNKVSNFGGFWNTAWVNFDEKLEKNVFANSTLKITIDKNGVVRYYKKTEENIIEYSATSDQNKPITDGSVIFRDSDTKLRLGSNSSSYPAFYNMTIKAVRVYNGVN